MNSSYFMGFAVCFGLIMILMPFYIKKLKNLNVNQVTSDYALDEYKNKEKTPIMGGLLFVLIPILVYLIIDYRNIDKRIMFIVLSYLLYSMIGFTDDMLVIRTRNNEGLSVKTRLILEFFIALVLFFVFKDVIACKVTIPIIHKIVELPIVVFLPFMILLFMAEANAVNFTDGMDGLCAGVSFICLTPFIYFSIRNANDTIALFIFCVLGGLLAYLFYNHHPAKIFMGDSGSLALGALFASISLVLDKTIPLFVIGGVFVVEMFCVCAQQLSVRLFKKRLFSYTPIHYAFVIQGYKEEKIVYGFYIFALVLCVIGVLLEII